MRRNTTIEMRCPYGDDCENTLTVVLSPFIRGTHEDPPEYPELVEVSGCVVHKAEIEKNDKPIWGALQEEEPVATSWPAWGRKE